MHGGYAFNAELLRMMLSEEREKFVTQLGAGASWVELNKTRQQINELTNLLDAAINTRYPTGAGGRGDAPGPR